MQFHDLKEKIIIIDFGSQVTKLIARRIRDLGVFSEIITINDTCTIIFLQLYYQVRICDSYII